MKASWAACIALAAFSAIACAQPKPTHFPPGYPNKPIRVLTGNPVGSGADVLLRASTQKLTERLGRPIVVDNRSGATGGIAVELGASAAPDGYTLLSCSTLSITAMVLKTVQVDIPKVLTPVAMLGSTPFLLVITPSVPVSSVKELIAYARTNPLVYASAGPGSTTHLGMELFKFMAGVDMTHVPYKGSGQSAVDLMAGRVQLALMNTLTATPIVKGGKLKALAVTTLHRTASLPDLPTVSESGVRGYELSTWYGLFAPIKTDRAIVKGLNAEVNAVMGSPEMRKKLAEGGAEVPDAYSPEKFREVVMREIDMWTNFVKTSRIKFD